MNDLKGFLGTATLFISIPFWTVVTLRVTGYDFGEQELLFPIALIGAILFTILSCYYFLGD